jgi:uncharacterized protein YgiB involved in biofilm formation
MKRSRYVALLTMGASALALAACDDPNEIVPVKAYATIAECAADGVSESACRTSFNEAEKAYEKAYPKYQSRLDCEDNAGPEQCEKDYPNSRDASWRPSMIGFIMGMAAARAQPQPVLPNAASPSGRATATGVPLAGRGPNVTMAARGASAPSAAQVAKSHTQARGGFGGSAARIASGSSSPSSASRSSGG